MQNWLGDVAASVRAEGVIYSPIEDGRVPLIDGRDIAAVAFEALVNPDLDRAHMVLSSMLALIELARSILAERKDGGTPWHAHHMRSAVPHWAPAFGRARDQPGEKRIQSASMNASPPAV